MIAYVLRYWPALTETFVRDEVEDLHRAGVAVRVLALGQRDDGGLVPPGVDTRRVPTGPGWLGEAVALARHGRLHHEGRRVAWLRAQLRGVRRAHVHFGGEVAVWTMLAALAEGIPYSVTLHGVDLHKPHPGLGEVLAAACQVWVVSAWQREWVSLRYGVAAELVRCGVEIRVDGAARAASTSRVAFTAARDVPKKGLDVLLAAARMLPDDAEVRLASERPAPRASTGARVDVLGSLPHGRVLEELLLARVACLPCRRAPDGDMDGLPVFLLEALGAGVPVVTTSMPGFDEVFDAEVGWIVPPDDPVALAQALREALDHPEEAARRGARGPARLAKQGATREAHLARVRALLARP